jgi:AcrR family transcriptional regulator
MTSAPATSLGRREKRKQEIRARIEDAAYHLFQRQGIDETSIEQICTEADVARRTFYGYFPNKHALLGGLGISRLYDQTAPMLAQLMQNHDSTRARLQGMIDYIGSNFSRYNSIDRQLILMAPTVFANQPQRQREIGNAALASFADLFAAGQAQGDATDTLTADMMAAMVVGTLNILTQNWALDADFPILDKLEEARRMFEGVICTDTG